MNIADLLARGKGFAASLHDCVPGALAARVPKGILIAILAALGIVASFGVGLLMGRQIGQGSGFVVEMLPLATTSAMSTTGKSAAATALPRGGQVVASKNGSRYYLPWCGGANRISTVNKVWFSSKKSAEAAGYTPAANCKGI
ncbi:MAG: hypothetical protein B7X04_00900 [Parcubacteria group bacterium 21-54-25]|nr:MAG: hypothetical protein B7X04_00900 [Parcubacteria group bacterium 21-54-25]HQU07789.1 hypothetical protein [Candidatus Paceibacterota bacterium]